MASRSRSSDTYADYDYDYHDYSQHAHTITSRASSASENSQDNQQPYLSDSSEEAASESSGYQSQNDYQDDNQAAYDYDYEYVDSNHSDHSSHQVQDEDASSSLEGDTNSQQDSSSDNASDSSSDTTLVGNTTPSPPKVPPGTKTSQCPFQAEPKRLDNDQLESLKAAVDPYLDHQKWLVSQGDTDIDAMMNGVNYYCISHGVTGGNWLAFVPPHEASAVWVEVREANEEGLLGGYATLRTRDDDNDCVIAVHVPDLDDCADVYHAFNNILRSTTTSRVSTFKLALLSTLGIYRADNASNVRYTYAELGLKATPIPDEAASLLGKDKKRGVVVRGEGRRNNNNGNNGGRRRRGGRNRKRRNRGRGAAGSGDGGYYERYKNRYYHGEKSSPTLPNGYWSTKNVEQGFVFHMGYYAQESGRGGNHRSSRGEAEGCAILDAHKARVYYYPDNISASERREVMRQLWATADKYDIVIGKWSVYVPARVADTVWKELCAANERGELGGCIKLSPYNASTDKFMMVVYCNDFTNTHDCERILYIVHNIVGRYDIDMIANFKPDFFSRIGVYRNRLLGTHVNYPLNELGLAKYWPHPDLKAILDRLKGR